MRKMQPLVNRGKDAVLPTPMGQRPEPPLPGTLTVEWAPIYDPGSRTPGVRLKIAGKSMEMDVFTAARLAANIHAAIDHANEIARTYQNLETLGIPDVDIRKRIIARMEELANEHLARQKEGEGD